MKIRGNLLPLRHLAVALLVCAALTLPFRTASAETPATAPAWTLKDTEGRVTHLADYRGKVVVLNFWATWCPPCRQEIPGFIALQEKYRSKGLVIVGVAMDEDPRAVPPFARRAGINYPLVYGTAQVAAAYGGLPVVPTTFLIGRDGKIAAMSERSLDEKTLEEALKPLL